MAAKPVPDGYHTVTPYLTVRDAPKVIEFLQQAFGAKISHEPIKRPDGTIMHAQVTVGDSPIMIGEESEMAKPTTSSLYLYVPDVDSAYPRAAKRYRHCPPSRAGREALPARRYYAAFCLTPKDQCRDQPCWLRGRGAMISLEKSARYEVEFSRRNVCGA